MKQITSKSMEKRIAIQKGEKVRPVAEKKYITIDGGQGCPPIMSERVKLNEGESQVIGKVLAEGYVDANRKIIVEDAYHHYELNLPYIEKGTHFLERFEMKSRKIIILEIEEEVSE